MYKGCKDGKIKLVSLYSLRRMFIHDDLFISCSTQEERCPLPSSGDSPPPPYSPPQVPPAGPEVPGTPKLSSMANPGETDHQPPNIGNDNMIADVNKNSGSSSASHSPAGSVRSRNNNNNNNHVPRYEEEVCPSAPPPPGFFI